MVGPIDKVMEKWKWLFTALVLLIAILVVSILASFLPFNPVEVEEFKVLPGTVCRGDFVELYLYQPERTEWWYTHGQAKGFNYWVAEDDPRPFRYAYFETDGSMFDTKNVQQPTRRFAPVSTGEYKAGLEVTVTGFIFGFIPTEQHTNNTTDNWITVEDCDSDGSRTLDEQ
jgi:hypothetical protein